MIFLVMQMSIFQKIKREKIRFKSWQKCDCNIVV